MKQNNNFAKLKLGIVLTVLLFLGFTLPFPYSAALLIIISLWLLFLGVKILRILQIKSVALVCFLLALTFTSNALFGNISVLQWPVLTALALLAVYKTKEQKRKTEEFKKLSQAWDCEKLKDSLLLNGLRNK